MYGDDIRRFAHQAGGIVESYLAEVAERNPRTIYAGDAGVIRFKLQQFAEHFIKEAKMPLLKKQVSAQENEIISKYAKQEHRNKADFIYHCVAVYMARTKRYDKDGTPLILSGDS